MSASGAELRSIITSPSSLQAWGIFAISVLAVANPLMSVLRRRILLASRSFPTTTALTHRAITTKRRWIMSSGRVTAIVFSGTAQVAAVQNPNRRAITFAVGDGSNACSCIIKDHVDATTSNGFPLTFSSGPITFRGMMATHRWSVIHLSVNGVLGIIEEFDENYAVPPENSGIKT